MKEVKKVLSAALAATLVTGAMGTVAGAAPIDDLYKAAYDATINALEKKDQDSINAAREAINKLPNELQGFKGEFSKQVDTVQHPILVTIVDSINNAEKTLKQVDINAARKSIPANLPEVWRNSYSTGVDNAQQKLIKKATDAADKAAQTGKKADLDIAKALLKEISTVENNDGVKTWLATYEKDFATRIKLTVDSLEVVSNNTIKVNFTREVDATSVVAKAFNIVQTENKTSIGVASAKVSEDKKSIEVRFTENVEAGKEYTVDVKDLKDLNGNTMVAATETFSYAKSESMTVKINKTMISINENLKNYIVVTDNLGRNITDDVKVSFECSDNTVVKDGIALKAGQVVITAVVKDTNGNVLVRSEKTIVEVKDSVATEYQGYSVANSDSNLANTYSKFDVTTQVKKGTSDSELVFFFKDQYGKEMQPVKVSKVLQNMNSGIATMDETTKKITAISEGTALFKVEVPTEGGKTVEKVVSVNVAASVKPAEVTLDKTSVSLVKGSAIKQQIKVAVKDQYKDAFKDDANGTVRFQVMKPNGTFTSISDADVAKFVTLDPVALVKGEGTITITAGANAGSNTFKVIYEHKDGTKVTETLEKQFTVTVGEAGTATGHEVGKVEALDLYDDSTTSKHETEGTFEVYKVNGTSRVEQVTGLAGDKGVSVKILDNNGDDATAKFAALSETAGTYKLAVIPGTPDNRTAATPVGTYTVKVSVGTTEVYSYTLTVKDTVKTAKAVTFKTDSVKLDASTPSAITAIVNVFDQDGKAIALAAGDKVEVVEGYKSGETTTSYDLTITKVKVTFADDANRADAIITLPEAKVIHVVK